MKPVSLLLSLVILAPGLRFAVLALILIAPFALAKLMTFGRTVRLAPPARAANNKSAAARAADGFNSV